MIPDLFTILNADSAVKLLLGAVPLRVYPGSAPEGVRKPYAVYNVFNATPENYLGNPPDIDNKGTQIDLYAEDFPGLQNCFSAVRAALEPHAHMTSYNTLGQDPETKLYRTVMQFDFWD